MEQEMFTTEAYGAGFPNVLGPKVKYDEFEKSSSSDKVVQYAKYSLMHYSKLFIRAATLLLVLYIVFQTAVVWLPQGIDAWHRVTGKKSAFSQQENLQWLGASTNVIRGDYENNQDSLAEAAMRTDARVTDLSTPAPVRAAFTSRERMLSPEEELMQKQSKNAEPAM